MDELKIWQDPVYAKATAKLLTNAAWAAGLFEGEGCFTLDKKNYLQCCMMHTDKDVLERFVKIVGVRKVNGPYFKTGLGKKPVYRWQVINKSAEQVIKMVGPFMCSRRKSKIIEIIERSGRY